MELSLELANTIIQGTFAEGIKIKTQPLTAVVLDVGGHIKALQRQDGASMLRPEIALGKAWGALSLGVHSRSLQKMAEERPTFINSLIATSSGKLVPVPGGILIADQNKILLGAVGVTGDSSDHDEICAIAGVMNAGLLLFS